MDDLEDAHLLHHPIDRPTRKTIGSLPALLVDRLDHSQPLQGIQPRRTKPLQECRLILLGQQQAPTGLANVLQHLDGGLEEANVPNREDQLDVTEMARAFSQLPSTGLASRILIRDALPSTYKARK
jgi:hypothetical protein